MEKYKIQFETDPDKYWESNVHNKKEQKIKTKEERKQVKVDFKKYAKKLK